LPSLDLVLCAFEVRMWRILDWPRLNLPVPVFLKRLAAPLWVFNFGMGFLCGKVLLNNVFQYSREGAGQLLAASFYILAGRFWNGER